MMGVIGCVLNLLGICIGGIILGVISRSKSNEAGMSTTWGTVSLVWGIIGTVLGFIIGLIILIVILTDPYFFSYYYYS